jgi:hypothetical protein
MLIFNLIVMTLKINYYYIYFLFLIKILFLILFLYNIIFDITQFLKVKEKSFSS